jgi:hypothetical protein
MKKLLLQKLMSEKEIGSHVTTENRGRVLRCCGSPLCSSLLHLSASVQLRSVSRWEFLGDELSEEWINFQGEYDREYDFQMIFIH